MLNGSDVPSPCQTLNNYLWSFSPTLPARSFSGLKIQKDQRGACWKCKSSVICFQKSWFWQRLGNLHLTAVIHTQVHLREFHPKMLPLGGYSPPLTHSHLPTTQRWTQHVVACEKHSTGIRMFWPWFPPSRHSRSAGETMAESCTDLCSSWVVQSTFEVAIRKVPPVHLDLLCTLFSKNELQPIPFPNNACKGTIDMDLEIRASIIKSRLKLGLWATASYFLKCLYFKWVDSAWKIPAGSKWERIPLNTNGNWVLALKKEYMLWAKPSGWQDGNRKTWG